MQKHSSLLSLAGQRVNLPSASFKSTYPLSHLGGLRRLVADTYMGDCFITLKGSPHGEPGLCATIMSSSFASNTASLYWGGALLSFVARNLVPICTPSAPIAR